MGKKASWIITLLAGLASFSIVLAPYLAYKGNPFAILVYELFHPLCHQIESRSFHLLGYKMGVCTRCLGIYIGTFAFGVFESITATRLIRINEKILLTMIAPLTIDGTAQLIGFYVSNNIIRFITGIFAGAAFVFFVFPRIWNISDFFSIENHRKEK